MDDKWPFANDAKGYYSQREVGVELLIYCDTTQTLLPASMLWGCILLESYGQHIKEHVPNMTLDECEIKSNQEKWNLKGRKEIEGAKCWLHHKL